MTERTPRTVLEVWASKGHRDGYDGICRPPKVSTGDCRKIYFAAWSIGTADAIRDQQERKERHGR